MYAVHPIFNCVNRKKYAVISVTCGYMLAAVLMQMNTANLAVGVVVNGSVPLSCVGNSLLLTNLMILYHLCLGTIVQLTTF